MVVTRLLHQVVGGLVARLTVELIRANRVEDVVYCSCCHCRAGYLTTIWPCWGDVNIKVFAVVICFNVFGFFDCGVDCIFVKHCFFLLNYWVITVWN